MKRGLDVLFDSAMEGSNERISQHVVKLDGWLFTLKTPEEIGLQMVRLILYDVKDISHKESIIGGDTLKWGLNSWVFAMISNCYAILLDEASNDLKKDL